MKIIEHFKQKKTVISFEVFPPKPDTPIETVFDTLEQLKNLNPDFISVTYGAGGSQKSRTIEIASKILSDYKIESMAHFTCVGHSKEEIDGLIEELKKNNIENILTLRGDPPNSEPNFDFSKNVYEYAFQLINHIRDKNKDDFCISAAAYTEGHVNSKRIKDDLMHLKNKVDAGVDFLITQLFFDNRIYYDFLDRAIGVGINCPITAGIMPIFNSDQIKKITAMCGASIPAKVVLMMDKYQGNTEDLRKAGIEYASYQLMDLLKNKVSGIHLMTMNRPKSVTEILSNIGLLR